MSATERVAPDPDPAEAGPRRTGSTSESSTSESSTSGQQVRRQRGRQLVSRTLTRAWDDDIFSESAAAAFWQTLSLPPLLLGLFGLLSYVGDWFGPDTIARVQQQIVELVGPVFSEQAVQDIIAPTVADVLTTARAEVVSIGFVISLWSGSSAMSSFVDAITRAHEQYLLRNPVWQRTLAILLYVVGLLSGVVALPLVAVGPNQIGRFLPQSWQATVLPLVDVLLLPVVGLVLVLALTTLYKVALPLKPPWYRGLPGALLAAVVFLVGATGLRAYLDWLTGTGYTYGALAAPIAFLLGTFFIGLAVVFGAHLNASVQALWPATLTDRRHRLARASEKISGAAEPSGSTDEEETASGARPDGTVVPGQVPDVLLTPDVMVLERAVRERPDVAAAVLEQMHYGVVDPVRPVANPLDGPAAVGDGARSGDGAGDGRR